MARETSSLLRSGETLSPQENSNSGGRVAVGRCCPRIRGLFCKIRDALVDAFDQLRAGLLSDLFNSKTVRQVQEEFDAFARLYEAPNGGAEEQEHFKKLMTLLQVQGKNRNVRRASYLLKDIVRSIPAEMDQGVALWKVKAFDVLCKEHHKNNPCEGLSLQEYVGKNILSRLREEERSSVYAVLMKHDSILIDSDAFFLERYEKHLYSLLGERKVAEVQGKLAKIKRLLRGEYEPGPNWSVVTLLSEVAEFVLVDADLLGPKIVRIFDTLCEGCHEAWKGRNSSSGSPLLLSDLKNFVGRFILNKLEKERRRAIEVVLKRYESILV